RRFPRTSASSSGRVLSSSAARARAATTGRTGWHSARSRSSCDRCGSGTSAGSRSWRNGKPARGGDGMIDDLTGAIEITQRIDAPPEIVFAYLTDSRRFVKWMGVGAELDPRPGGRYRIDVDGEHIATGHYREIEPPRRLVMTWGWEGHPTVPPGWITGDSSR